MIRHNARCYSCKSPAKELRRNGRFAGYRCRVKGCLRNASRFWPDPIPAASGCNWLQRQIVSRDVFVIVTIPQVAR